MPIKTKTITMDDAGTAHVSLAPCFFAGNDAGAAFVDSHAGHLDVHYSAGSMPFIAGDLAVTGTPNVEYRYFVDERL